MLKIEKALLIVEAYEFTDVVKLVEDERFDGMKVDQIQLIDKDENKHYRQGLILENKASRYKVELVSKESVPADLKK